MDVFCDILGEREFKFFTPYDYKALQGVLNDVLCMSLKDYLNNPQADKEVVSAISNFLGPTIESMTFHNVLKDRGIIELIRKLSPATILSSDVDRDAVREQLQFLHENSDKCLTLIPCRDSVMWKRFREAIADVHSRMLAEGITPTYVDMLDRLDANKFVFYMPNEKGHSTQIGVISSKRREWVTCLRGLQYVKYCDEHGVDYVKRRAF